MSYERSTRLLTYFASLPKVFTMRDRVVSTIRCVKEEKIFLSFNFVIILHPNVSICLCEC